MIKPGIYCSPSFRAAYLASTTDVTRPPSLLRELPFEYRIVSWLPTWNPQVDIVSLDRFATYDVGDAEWAVPAGLAKWVGRYIRAVVFSQDGRVGLIYDLPKK